jgi:hypothetical protein
MRSVLFLARERRAAAAPTGVQRRRGTQLGIQHHTERPS